MRKSEFVNRLESGHVFLGCTHSPARTERIAECLTHIHEAPTRTVTARRTNHLVFSDGSRLYFDSFAKRIYTDLGNGVVMLQITENGSDYSKYLYYYIIAR